MKFYVLSQANDSLHIGTRTIRLGDVVTGTGVQEIRTTLSNKSRGRYLNMRELQEKKENFMISHDNPAC